jgi:hypothetical protein
MNLGLFLYRWCAHYPSYLSNVYRACSFFMKLDLFCIDSTCVIYRKIRYSNYSKFCTPPTPAYVQRGFPVRRVRCFPPTCTHTHMFEGWVLDVSWEKFWCEELVSWQFSLKVFGFCVLCARSTHLNIPLKQDTTVQKPIGRASASVYFVDCWTGNALLKNSSG